MDMSGGDFTDALFVAANMRADWNETVDLRNATFVRTDFQTARWGGDGWTRFDGSDLTCARMGGLPTLRVSWTGATCPDGTVEDGSGCADHLTIDEGACGF